MTAVTFLGAKIADDDVILHIRVTGGLAVFADILTTEGGTSDPELPLVLAKTATIANTRAGVFRIPFFAPVLPLLVWEAFQFAACGFFTLEHKGIPVSTGWELTGFAARLAPGSSWKNWI